MRQVTTDQYNYSKAVLAAYTDYCKPYVQKDGWTVIPKEAPRFEFEGVATDINIHSTFVELFELANQKPEKFSAYVTYPAVTTWTGEHVAEISWRGAWHRNNFGGKWRQLTIQSDWGHVYTGREYDSRQLVNFRRVKR